MQFFIDITNVLFVGITDNFLEILTYGIPILIFYIIFQRIRTKDSNKNLDFFIGIKEAGLTEPASLHPLINTNLCVGCGSCVTACPEGNVLGLIDDRARLINATHCIGHGACKEACPMEAITLVFGTERRGVDIPLLKPDFETNVPGIYIAGELGGMGLVRNAITQGRQAMDAIKTAIATAKDAPTDVVIIGAGPAGFSATLGAHEANLNYVTVEQDSLGGAVAHFPRGKLVMTSTAILPIIGEVKLTEIRKEPLVEFWQAVEQKTGIRINYKERMDMITQSDSGGLIVKTNHNTYHTKTVLLSIGRRGTPRKIGAPGEDQAKVVYRLIDPEQYRGMHVLVVGGGNSALEAAVSIAEEEGTTTTLSYRSDAFSRAAEQNRDNVTRMEAENRLTVLLKSNVKNIGEKDVTIDHQGKLITIPNDAVIVSAGGVLPTPFLKKIGIQVDVKNGEP